MKRDLTLTIEQKLQYLILATIVCVAIINYLV